MYGEGVSLNSCFIIASNTLSFQSSPRLTYDGHWLQVSESGDVLDLLMDPSGERVAFVSAAKEHGGYLYLGNLVQDYVSRIRL